ncbi:preprotein translocase subunit SECE1 [Senna tora]|uniref:Preprotein translocase subunit SECE1 n=1 Tax=Senna tora TaxID=362788 RepID=A0A834X305_9FABA|nr:preprotein translocase subunit SECE1 [Senna tora]
MALHAFQHLPIASPFPTPVTLKIESPTLNLPLLLNRSPPIGITVFAERRRRRIPVAHVVKESQDSSEPEPDDDKGPEVSELASELKKAMQERKEKEGENLWSGVAEEIREIEWPAFGKVLGTTGVVISVILGSSVVLLTVNAVLAELSDQVFAGKGVQDFFS